MKKIFLLTLIISCIFCDNRLKLKKANVLENKTIDGQSIKYISGNVIFTKNDLTLTCQEGRHYEQKDLAILYRRVTALQNGRTLTCDTLKFFSSEDKIMSIGSSHVWDIDYDLKADSLIVYTERDSGIALGNVLLIQKGQTISADKIEYQKNPIKDGISYTAYGNVVIKDSSRVANCGKARYNRTNEITTLEINPEISADNQILSGKKIIMNYHEEELEKLFIPENAFAITPVSGFQYSKSDSKDSIAFNDKLEGTSLTSYFRNGIIDSLRIEGMARTLYHVFDDSIYQGKNNASGDTIVMKFLENELEQLNIIGGSEGIYSPDSMSNNKDTPIFYSANKIEYRLKNEESDLTGQAKLKHDMTQLEAGFINIKWDTQLLNAKPRIESDSLSEKLYPIIKEKGEDPMNGEQMTYNLQTKKGKIVKGNSTLDDGFYTGQQIRNETEKVFYIEHSKYTTCDLDTAHFHFESNKMKIIQDNLVIAQPIILHLGQIPVLGIPLGLFPHKGGKRHSGWIMPSYGETKSRGQFINGLGFYWAPNDYWDSKITMDFGDRQGAVLNLNNKYVVRYKFSGGLSFRNQQYLDASDNISDISDARKSSTNIKWTHRQILRNNQSFNANTTYSSSGDYNKKYGLSEADRMNQKSISNISYSKRWPKAKNSFSISYYSNRDLLIDDKVNSNSSYFVIPTKSGSQLNIVNRTFPKLSFRHGQSNLFPSTAVKKNWYNNITWNYGLNYNNKNREFYESSFIDSLNDFSWKNSNGILISNSEQNSGWTHTSSINAPQKLFKYISFNPRLNLKSIWVNEYFEGIWDDSAKVFQKLKKEGFTTRTTGSFSLNANTKVYGLFPIPIGPIKVIRHVMSPSLGYSWTPDFSKPLFGQDLGYIITKTDSTGKEYYHDKFSGTMGGNTPRSESKSMSFSLNNIYQAKIIKGEKDKKIDLFNWRMNGSYNFAADSLNLSNIRSSIRSKIAGKLNLDLSMSHDFYKYNTEKKRRISKFNTSENGFISPRLTSARLSTGLRFSGDRWDNNIIEEPRDLDTTNIDEDLAGPGLTNPFGNNNTLSGKKLWSTNLSISYAYSAINPLSPIKTFWVSTNSSINVTQKWRMSYQARFDLINKDLVAHSINIHRDLHCWELSVRWTPTGIGQGISFKLNVKSPTLKDLKIEKESGIYAKSGF